MLEPLTFIIVCLICSILLLFLLKKRDKKKITPSVLSKQMLRYPERILIDVPLYASTSQGLMSYDFLLETETVLASIGELQTRRQFLVHFAEVVKSPSKDSLKGLTNFLFHVAPETFEDTLRWDGKCDTPIRFLEFMHRLIEDIDKGRKLRDIQRGLQKKGRAPKNPSKELQGIDAKIVQEWFDLHDALYKAIIPWKVPSHSKTRKRKGSPHFGSVCLTDEDKVPHLLPFLKAAREVYKSIPIGVTDTAESAEATG